MGAALLLSGGDWEENGVVRKVPGIALGTCRQQEWKESLLVSEELLGL